MEKDINLNISNNDERQKTVQKKKKKIDDSDEDIQKIFNQMSKTRLTGNI